MYKEILLEIAECMEAGGEFIVLKKDVESLRWIVLVMDKKGGVYFAYTLGFTNRDFIFDLIDFCWNNQYRIEVSLN